MTTTPGVTNTAYALARPVNDSGVREILADQGLVGDTIRFAYLGLSDP